mmetsp:Transcript_11681/g.26191  ORF Transcript_11681/g.26191 Transcript_11681/m.26191 type:complete len:235 (-) Transcript_11681:893-1597(-)
MPSETSQTDRNFYKTCSRTCPWERIPTSGCLNSQEKMACSPFASRRLGRDTAKTDSGGTTSEDCVLKMSIQITKHFCKPSCKSSTEGQINNKAHSSQLLFFPGKIKRKGYALCSFLTKLRLCMFVRFSVSNSQSSSTIILYHSTTSSSQKSSAIVHLTLPPPSVSSVRMSACAMPATWRSSTLTWSASRLSRACVDMITYGTPYRPCCSSSALPAMHAICSFVIATTSLPSAAS